MNTKLIALVLALCLWAGMAPLALAKEARTTEAEERLSFEIESEDDIQVGEYDGDFVFEEPLDFTVEPAITEVDSFDVGDESIPFDIALSNEAENVEEAGNDSDHEHEYVLIDYDHYECKVCGATQEFTKTKLTVEYTGDTLTKVYDKTRNVINSSGTWLLSKKLDKSKDFTLYGIDKAHKKVEIKKIYISKFDKADAGSYELSVRFDLGGDDAGWYEAENTTIPARITKRPVYVVPYAGLKKVYGTNDPSTLGISCKVENGGLILTKEEQEAYQRGELKLATGGMSREPGEDVGTYKFTLGTLDFGDDNYDVYIRPEVFTIEKKSINNTDVDMDPIGNQCYTGKAITPDVTLRYRTFTLKEGTDYTLSYKNNKSVGKATVIITGKGNYSGSREVIFSIECMSINSSDVDMSPIDNQCYTGKAITPAITLRYRTFTLKEGTDYTLSYKNNKSVGKATVIITGKGNYTGSRKVTFSIGPKGTTISKLTAGKKKITVRWKKQKNATGYQIAYSRKSSFSFWEDKIIKGNRTAKHTLKGLKAKKTYYVRIRTYKRVNGKNYYSPWSKAKKVKTK